MTKSRTLYDKLWDSHVVRDYGDGSALLYIDRHVLHEVSTPVSFQMMDAAGRRIRRPAAHLAVADHAVPTTARASAIANALARAQVARLEENVARHGVRYLPLDGPDQGIVHVIGPETGFTIPGATLVCGDSHTSTHGAFGALAFGIGASECAVVMATSCLRQKRARTMRVSVTGQRAPHVTAKDIALAMIARVGANGASGHAIEYAGPVIDAMSMTERMTLCNMSIEAGARMGLIAPDAMTFAYLEGRELAPKGALWNRAVAAWSTLASDADAVFDRDLELDVTDLTPHVTWGTSPEDALPVTGVLPDPDRISDPARKARTEKALRYMGLRPGQPLAGTAIDYVFIGSCTNGRLEDLRAAAEVLRGRRVFPGVTALAVPGSGRIRAEAEAEGLDRVFIEAGFEWRHAGCSMCVAMNGDTIGPGARCASTSNRNFEGRQGRGGRTHLMSPAMAAAAAVAGHITDIGAFDTERGGAA